MAQTSFRGSNATVAALAGIQILLLPTSREAGTTTTKQVTLGGGRPTHAHTHTERHFQKGELQVQRQGCRGASGLEMNFCCSGRGVGGQSVNDRYLNLPGFLVFLLAKRKLEAFARVPAFRLASLHGGKHGVQTHSQSSQETGWFARYQLPTQLWVSKCQVSASATR